MGKIASLLCSLLVVGLLASSATVSAGDVALQDQPISCTKDGLNCLANLATDTLRKLLRGLTIPGLKGDLKVLGAIQVQFEIHDLVIDVDVELNTNLKTMDCNGDGTSCTAVLVVAFGHIEISAGLSYSLKLLLINSQRNIDIDIIVANLHAEVTVTIKFDANGLPTLHVDACVCDFTSVYIDIQGCPPLIDTALETVVKPLLDVQLQLSLCAVLDVAVTSEGFTVLLQAAVASSLTGILPGQDLTKDLTMKVNDLVTQLLDTITALINSLTWHIFGKFPLLGWENFLTTTCTEKCLGSLLPILATRFPGCPVEIDIKCLSVDITDIGLLSATAKVTLRVVITVTPLGKDPVTVLDLELRVYVVLNVKLNTDNCLQVDFLRVNATLDIKSSLIGPIRADVLIQLRDILVDLLYFDLNKIGADNVLALPFPGLFHCINPVLKAVGNLVLYAADLLCTLLGGK